MEQKGSLGSAAVKARVSIGDGVALVGQAWRSVRRLWQHAGAPHILGQPSVGA